MSGDVVIERRVPGVVIGIALSLTACAGPPDAARCGERLEVTPTIAASIDRADTVVLFLRGRPGQVLAHRFDDASPAGMVAVSARVAEDVTVSPDGALLAVADREAGDLLVVTAATGERRSLGVDAVHPAWSPDGDTIAAATPAGELVLIAADGGEVRSLDPVPDPGPMYAPSWSPDGRRLLVAVDADPETLGYDELHVIDVEERVSSRIVRGVSLDGPSWAPDGTRIAYHDFDGVNIACSDGGLTSRVSADGLFPAWSPDGSEIVLTTLREEDGGIGLIVIPTLGGGGFRISESDDVAIEWSPVPLP